MGNEEYNRIIFEIDEIHKRGENPKIEQSNLIRQMIKKERSEH
jgi:hypothetical protein